MISEHTKLPLFGVGVDSIKKIELVQKLNKHIQQKHGFIYVVTANPEIVLKAQHNEPYRNALNAGNYMTIDGFGLACANTLINHQTIPRITGIELSIDLIQLAEQNKYSILILNNKNGLSSSQTILNYFSKNYPTIKVTTLDIDPNDIDYQKTVISVDKIMPQIIFSTLGAPHQELVLHHIKKYTSVHGVGIGNGASIDFLIGTQKRAPNLFQKIGLEWLWRLITRPTRIKRIINAAIIFPLFALKWRIRMVTSYRHTAMGCILNKQNEILIAHFPENDQWGLPKGGVEKAESIEAAARREMHEELGIKSESLTTLHTTKYFHKYIWPYWHKANRGYKGQRVSLCIFRYNKNAYQIQPDGHEVDAYKWVSPQSLITNISPNRKALAIKLLKILKEHL